MPKIILFPSPFRSDRTFHTVEPGTTVREAVALTKPSAHFSGALLVLNDRQVDISDQVMGNEDTLIVRAVPAGGVGDAIGRAAGDSWKVMTQMAQNPFLLVSGAFLLGGAMTFLYSLGSSAASSLIPKPPHFDTSTTNGSLGLHGGRNGLKPYTPVPLVLGKSIISPPLASKIFTDWDGSNPAKQILSQVFVVGMGRLAITAMKIGDRALTDFAVAPTASVQTLTNDAYGKIVTEAGVGIELKASAPQIQVSVADIDAMSLDINFPSGLCSYNSNGDRTTSRTIGLTVEYKKTTTGSWAGAASFALSYAENFTQAITKKADITQAMLNAAGRAGYTGTWDVRITRSTTDSTDSKNVDRTAWSVLRSIQLKEPMSAAAKGITTRVALTIQATDQLNGAIDNFNVEAQSVVPCYDGTGSGAAEWKGATALGYPSTWKNVNMTTGGYTWNTWTGDATSNPAALYLWILRGPANPKPVPDTLIDWPAFEAWYTFCASKGLEVNAVWDQGGAMLDLLDKIAGTGRAASMMRDSKYSVIFDQPQSVPVQHFTPRNSRNFSASKAFPTPVHAIRSQFIDKDSAWKQAEQIVYMAGYSAGTATEFRTQQLWGVTNYQQAYKAIFYQVAVETLRPEIYQMEVDFEHLACQRGDLVAVSHDVLLYGLQAARVVSLTVNGGGQALTVTLDEDVTMEVGKSYGLRWRRMDGTSVVAPVNLTVGTTRTLTFTTPVVVGSVPEVDDLCSFGISGSETQMMLVVSIEMQDEFSARVTLNNYDPAVYTADSGAIPAWSSGISLPAPVGYGDIPDLSVPTTAPVAAPTRAADTAYVDAQKQVAPSDTALALRVPMADLPELPDNAAGVAYQNDASWTGWALGGSGTGSTKSVANGIITLVNAGVSGGNYLIRSGALTVSFLIVRARQTSGVLDTLRVDYIGGTGSTTVGPLSAQWQTFIIPVSGTCSAVALASFNYPTLPSTIEAQMYLAGDVTYASKNVYYQNNGVANDAVNPWAPSGTATVNFTGGNMVLATTANGAYAVKTLAGMPSSGRIRFSARQTAGALGIIRVDVVGGGTGTWVVQPALTANFQVYELTWTGVLTGLNFLITNYAAQTYTLEMDWIDISDGIYGPLQDTSPNSLKLSTPPGVIRISGPRSPGFFNRGSWGPSVLNTNLGLSGSSFTISRWVKWSGSPTKDNYFGVLSALGLRQYLHFGVKNSNKTIYLGFYSDDLGGTTTLSSDTWYHIVATFNKNTLVRKIYINGALEAQGTAGGALSLANTSAVYLLSGVGDNGEGYAAETRVDLREFTAAEVLGLYAQTPAPDPKATEVAVVQRAPKYLGASTTPPANANPSDWYLALDYPAANGSGGRKWTGSAWVDDTDRSHLQAAGADIVAWCALSVSHTPPAGWNFIENLAVLNLFVTNLMAQFLKIQTGGSLRGGDRYASDGSLADGSKSGFFLGANGSCKLAGVTFEGSQGGGVQWTGGAQLGSGLAVTSGVKSLASLNGTDVALNVEGGANQLRTYRFNGSTWSQVGSSLTTGSSGLSFLAALNNTDIAYFDTFNDVLKTYRFNGSTWSQVGSSLSIPGTSSSCGIATLTNTDIAFVDFSGAQLRTYRFNGSTWSQVGSSLSISGIGFPAIAALNNTDIAYFDNGNDQLRTYRFNGSTWSQVGSSLSISGIGNSCAMAAINGTDVTFTNNSDDQLRMYRFDGNTWAQVNAAGSAVMAGAGDAALAALTGTDVAYVASLTNTLIVYRYAFSLATPYRP